MANIESKLALIVNALTEREVRGARGALLPHASSPVFVHEDNEQYSDEVTLVETDLASTGETSAMPVTQERPSDTLVYGMYE